MPEARGSAARRGYGPAWRRARAAFLRRNPLCASCRAEGRLRAAVVVDHITPHRGDPGLFWDRETNWQGLCRRHHDLKTAAEALERRTGRRRPRVPGVDADGYARDPGDPWSRPRRGGSA